MIISIGWVNNGFMGQLTDVGNKHGSLAEEDIIAV